MRTSAAVNNVMTAVRHWEVCSFHQHRDYFLLPVDLPPSGHKEECRSNAIWNFSHSEVAGWTEPKPYICSPLNQNTEVKNSILHITYSICIQCYHQSWDLCRCPCKKRESTKNKVKSRTFSQSFILWKWLFPSRRWYCCGTANEGRGQLGGTGWAGLEEDREQRRRQICNGDAGKRRGRQLLHYGPHIIITPHILQTLPFTVRP